MERMRGPPIDAVSQRAPYRDVWQPPEGLRHESVWDMEAQANNVAAGSARGKQTSAVECNPTLDGHERERDRRPSRVALDPTPVKSYSRKPPTQADKVRESVTTGKRLLSPGILNFTAKPPSADKPDRPRSSSRNDERPIRPPILFNGQSNQETSVGNAGAFDVSEVSTTWYDEEDILDKEDSDDGSCTTRSSHQQKRTPPKEQRNPRPTRGARKKSPQQHSAGNSGRRPAGRQARFPGEYGSDNNDVKGNNNDKKRDYRKPEKGQEVASRNTGGEIAEGNERPFYDVVKKNAYKPQKPYQPNNKRKREWSGNKHVIELKSAPEPEGKELYVEGLDYSQWYCHADL